VVIGEAIHIGLLSLSCRQGEVVELSKVTLYQRALTIKKSYVTHAKACPGAIVSGGARPPLSAGQRQNLPDIHYQEL
jgi:hypothetical protein